MPSILYLDQFDVTGGPSREDLFDALRLQLYNMSVVFAWREGDVDRGSIVYVRGISARDDSGDSWLIEGRTGDAEKNLIRRSQPVKIYFCTMRRKGRICFPAQS